MSKHHRFLTTKDLHWSWFNALAFGKVPPEDGGASLAAVIAEVESMKAAALTFTAATPGWSNSIGLFFHVFGHNSVNALHLHVLDMSAVGPTFKWFDYKNCHVDSILKVLKEELIAGNVPATLDETALCAAEAAAAAAEAATAAAQAVEEMKTMGRSQTWMSTGPEKVKGDILELNVGGKVTLSVARATLLVTPSDSLFHQMFSDSWDSPQLVVDTDGRIFLDFPASSFERIVDHLRLLRLAPPHKVLQPPKIPPLELQEFKLLAGLLGVEDFLLAAARNGRADCGTEVVIDDRTCGCRC
jgi:hypothetical protein